MDKMEAIPKSSTKDPVFRNLNRVARYAALNEEDRIAYKKSLLARSGWFYVTGFKLYNLLKKGGFNMADAYSGNIHPLDYHLKELN